MLFGIGPVNLLLDMYNPLIRGRRRHMSSGRLPVRLLFEKSIPVDREERLKIVEGIVPLKKLFVSDTSSNSARLPNS